MARRLFSLLFYKIRSLVHVNTYEFNLNHTICHKKKKSISISVTALFTFNSLSQQLSAFISSEHQVRTAPARRQIVAQAAAPAAQPKDQVMVLHHGLRTLRGHRSCRGPERLHVLHTSTYYIL